jgi:hypothetical protein
LLLGQSQAQLAAESGATRGEFFDFEGFEALVTSAAKIDPRKRLFVLLGGEAGLRSGDKLATVRTNRTCVGKIPDFNDLARPVTEPPPPARA